MSMNGPHLNRVGSGGEPSVVCLTHEETSRRSIWEPDIYRVHFGRKDPTDPHDPVTCHIVEPSGTSPHVSRRHATLTLERRPFDFSRQWRALIRDGYLDQRSGRSVPSTNGTFVNNVRCGHESHWVRTATPCPVTTFSPLSNACLDHSSSSVRC